MPSPTITTKDRFSVVKPEFIANNYSGGGQLSSLDNPCPAVMTNPKQNVIACKWYLMNPQFSNAGGSVEKPCFTLIAKMDKKRLLLRQKSRRSSFIKDRFICFTTPMFRQAREPRSYT